MHDSYFFYYNRDPFVTPKGFLSPDEKSIKVTFHVILPVPFWEWDLTSKICIQFDNQDLGAWQYNCGIESFNQRYIIQFSALSSLNVARNTRRHFLKLNFLDGNHQ